VGCFLATYSVTLDETGDFPTRILIRHHLSAIMTRTFLNNQFTSALSYVNIGCEVDRFSEVKERKPVFTRYVYFTKKCLCLSNRIKMSKSDIYVPSFHIYVQITLYISKVQYICPKLQYVYPNPATCFRFIYNSQMILHISIQFRYKYFTDFFSIYISCGQYLM